MRINKYLALCGLGSRRQVEDIILEGRVSGSKGKINELGYQVEDGELIKVSNKIVKPPTTHRYYAFNKPKNVLCTRTDPQGRTTVYDILPNNLKNLHLVGRLDYHSRGLLLLTDDGNLTQKLLRPEFGVEREYWVWTKPSFPEKKLLLLQKGTVDENGQRLKPKKVTWYPGMLRFVLNEGKNREIRKIIESVEDYKVRDLLRVRYGAVELGELAEGKSRGLHSHEINSLLPLKKPIKEG